LDAELARFKAIVRHIARHELPDHQAEMFTMDDNSRYRRLAKVGVYGHQAGIAAHVSTTVEEDQDIVISILGQKTGSNPKNIQAAKDYVRAKSGGQEGCIRIKIARLATKSTIKWKRIRATGGDMEQVVRQPEAPSYSSRLLTCSMCYQPQETWWMQLRTTKGFRAIHCKYCKYQEYTAKTNCQCGIRWHHCQVHRIDPLFHSSKRGRLRTKVEQKGKARKTVAIKSSLRMAPILVNTGNKAGKGAARRKRKRASTLTRHTISTGTAYPPAQAMLQRIRLKAAAKLTQRALESDPNKAEGPAAKELIISKNADEQRRYTEVTTRGKASSSIAASRTAREDLKQALITKAANDKRESLGIMRNSEKSSSASTIEQKKAKLLPPRVSARPSESEAIRRLLSS